MHHFEWVGEFGCTEEGKKSKQQQNFKKWKPGNCLGGELPFGVMNLV